MLLIRFKGRYQDQLKSFRLSIDELIWTLSAITNEEDRNNLLQTKIEIIKSKKEELVARLNENRVGRIVYGAVKGMVVDTVIAIVTGNAIQPAATVLNTINEELAYLALID